MNEEEVKQQIKRYRKSPKSCNDWVKKVDDTLHELMQSKTIEDKIKHWDAFKKCIIGLGDNPNSLNTLLMCSVIKDLGDKYWEV